MLTLKFMGHENFPDADSRKSHMLIHNVDSVNFTRPPNSKPLALVTFTTGDQEEFKLDGNVYVLNHDGKTIDTFGAGRAV